MISLLFSFKVKLKGRKKPTTKTQQGDIMDRNLLIFISAIGFIGSIFLINVECTLLPLANFAHGLGWLALPLCSIVIFTSLRDSGIISLLRW